MENLDVHALVRMVCIYAHVLAFAAAFVSVALGDFAIFARQRVDLALLARSARNVTLTLAALWITGLAVVWLDTRFDPAAVFRAPKLLAKLSVVLLLTANGVALHRLAFPRFAQVHTDPHRAALLPTVLGAISITTWLYAAFIGIGRAAERPLGFGGFLALYLAALVTGVGLALVQIRPRLASRLLLADAAGGVGKA